MKILKCGEIGFDCDAVMCAETEEAIIWLAATHTRTVHNLSEISEQAVTKIRALIRDETPQPNRVVSH